MRLVRRPAAEHRERGNLDYFHAICHLRGQSVCFQATVRAHHDGCGHRSASKHHSCALFPTIGRDPLAWRGVFATKQNCAAVCTLSFVTALRGSPRHLSEGVSRTKYSHVLSNDCSVPLAHRLGFSLWRSSSFWRAMVVAKSASVQSLALLLIGVAIRGVGLVRNPCLCALDSCFYGEGFDVNRANCYFGGIMAGGIAASHLRLRFRRVLEGFVWPFAECGAL